MFCPQCGSENNAESYCRQCGQPLAAVRLAMDGRIEEAIKTTKRDKKLTGYRLRIGLASFLILIAIATIFTRGKIGFSNIPSAALIIIFMMIFFIWLSRKFYRVARLLDADDQTVAPNLTSRLADDRQLAPGSITEQSTLKLQPDDRIRRD